MICVDKIRKVKRSMTWHWTKACHLYDDNNDIDALHKFARLLNLKPEWFQNRIDFPHYDLTERKRNLAIAMGATEREFKKSRKE